MTSSTPRRGGRDNERHDLRESGIPGRYGTIENATHVASNVITMLKHGGGHRGELAGGGIDRKFE